MRLSAQTEQLWAQKLFLGGGGGLAMEHFHLLKVGCKVSMLCPLKEIWHQVAEQRSCKDLPCNEGKGDPP